MIGRVSWGGNRHYFLPNTASVLHKSCQLLDLLIFRLQLLLEFGHLALIDILVESVLVLFQYTVSYLLATHLLDAFFLRVDHEVVFVVLFI